MQEGVKASEPPDRLSALINFPLGILIPEIRVCNKIAKRKAALLLRCTSAPCPQLGVQLSTPLSLLSLTVVHLHTPPTTGLSLVSSISDELSWTEHMF